MDHVARMAGRHAKLPIVMYPIRGKGRTKLMRNLPFWTRFFQLTLPEREEAARKLIATINPADKAAALATLRQVADQLRERARPHPHRQRRRGWHRRTGTVVLTGDVEQAVGHAFRLTTQR